MNVVLIGARGAGKTSVGKALAALLGREFIDSDEHIEKKTHLSIREIFELGGESHFRSIESQAVAEIAKLDGKVIATGGGVPLKHKNMQALRRNGAVFYLEVSPETAFQRLQGDPTARSRRPPLTDLSPADEIRGQIESRRPYYVSGADVTISTETKRVENLVSEILEHLKVWRIEERGDLDTAPA